MSFFKNIKIEIFILLLISSSIFLSFELDLKIYNYFKNVNNGFSGFYLKEFFVNITRLGDSFWYFLISISGFTFFYIINKFKIINFDGNQKFFNFFISLFFFILTIGIITQVGKHIIGRPRPNYTNFEDPFVFNFFTIESNYHSFPSGHSSTIFMVCFIMVAAFPKLKYLFYFLSSIVALSRVVVGAHFFTDIIAGAILALITFKVLSKLIEKKYTHLMLSNIMPEKNPELLYYVLFLCISCIFITAGPSSDLYISSLFYNGDSQFMIQSFDMISIILRDFLLPFIIVYILILPLVCRLTNIKKIFFGYVFSIKEISLLWFSQSICVLIFINLILKNYWGRARPNDILELGGKESFSPWYELSYACQSNCSFVSGDASVGFSVIMLYLITKKTIFLYFSITTGFLLGLIRIMAGGHFLSDIFFAGFIVVFLNIILFGIYKKYNVK